MDFHTPYFLSRTKELLVWMGIPFLGALAGEHFSFGPRLVFFITAVVFAMAHVLLLNDWGGLIKNPLEQERYSGIKNIKALQFFLGFGAVSAFVIGVFIGSFLIPLKDLFLLAVTGLVFSIFYSHPKLHFKEDIFGSSILHFLGGILQFLLGYMVFSEWWPRGVLLGAFLSFLFVAGHFVHECRHFEEDIRGKVWTSATRFGVLPVVKIALIVFMIAHFYLIVIAAVRMVPLSWVVIATFPAIVHLLFLRDLVSVSILSRALLDNYQKFYRIAYTSAFLVFCIHRAFQAFKIADAL